MPWDSLLDILKKAQMRHPAFGKRMQEAEALTRWEAAVGPHIARHTRAIKVEDSVLWVEVDHPIWKSELHHRKRQILDILNHGHPEGTRSDSKSKPLAAAQEALKDLFLVEPRRHRG